MINDLQPTCFIEKAKSSLPGMIGVMMKGQIKQLIVHHRQRNLG